ncbi:hypothetical protein [Streptomyces albidoflavus]|uniref:hypothetical protein n=1 Tax=Streptomyces albidoflavus TaxID=1886 RepID=UPI003316E475
MPQKRSSPGPSQLADAVRPVIDSVLPGAEVTLISSPLSVHGVAVTAVSSEDTRTADQLYDAFASRLREDGWSVDERPRAADEPYVVAGKAGLGAAGFSCRPGGVSFSLLPDGSRERPGGEELPDEREAAQRAVAAEIREAIGAAFRRPVHPDDLFGDPEPGSVRVAGWPRGRDGPDNEAALEASSAYLRAHGWQDLPEPTDSDDRSVSLYREGVKGARLYAANGQLIFTGEVRG